MVPEELIFKRVGPELALTARMGRGDNPVIQIRGDGQVLHRHRLSALRLRWLTGEHDTLTLGPATYVCLTSGDYAALYKWGVRLQAQRAVAVIEAQAQTRLAAHVRSRRSPLAERARGELVAA